MQAVEAPDREMVEFYARFIRPGDLCFDIGAHVGARTEIFLELGARVVCVEPQPRCIQVLTARYSGDARVTLVAEGAAERGGTLTMSLCHAAPTISTFAEKWKTGRFSDYRWNGTAEVKVTTLDDLIARFGVPAFCKIDVEGYEVQVLRGLNRPLPMLSFEFSREFLDDARTCMERLAALGSVEFNCGLGEAVAMAMPRWANVEEAMAFLHGQDDELLWGDIYARSC